MYTFSYNCWVFARIIVSKMTHINEFAPLIRDPTPEHAQNAMDIIIPSDAVTGILPNIFNRLDNHEPTEEIATDTVYDVIDIVENQLNAGIDNVFNSGIAERISTMVLNIINSVVQRATETFLV